MVVLLAHRAIRRSAGVIVAAVAVGASVLGTGAAEASSAPVAVDARPFVSGDHTIAVFDLADAITEEIEVETGSDGDRDGHIDRVFVRLVRPSTSAKVPLIVHASPYYAGGTSDWETAYFVPRGYAVAQVSLTGTDRSTGCNDVGGALEVQGGKAVVDWANGRARGFAAGTVTANRASWSTGKVAMIGGSWDGTIANAVAATGVEGLETIVPIAAISNWYDYTRGNGTPFHAEYTAFLHRYVSSFQSSTCTAMTDELQAASDDATGNENAWWAERDYRLDASKITASVFVVHGLEDENVKTGQFGNWWEQLEANDVERKLFLHQGGHLDPYAWYGAAYAEPLLAWFDYYLQDLDNGVATGPEAIVQRESGAWSSDKVWPPAGTKTRKMRLSQSGDRSVGALTVGDVAPAKPVKTVTIKQSVPLSPDTVVANPTTPGADRAVFMTDRLDTALRESGTATVRLRVKVDRAAAGFQARVVDYSGTTAYIVSRTLADLGHHESLEHKATLKPGKWYWLEWEINTDDHVFAANHRLGLVITAEQHNPTAAYEPVTATIKTDSSWLKMPVSGDLSGLDTAGAVERVVTTSVTPAEPTRDVEEFVREFFEGTR